MPCNCDHMEPNLRERESVKVMGFLSEANIYDGEVPCYGNTNALDDHAALLCNFCQSNDLRVYSLELQIWWRDHQKADKDRLEREQAEAKTEQKKRDAIAKLSPYERELLGV